MMRPEKLLAKALGNPAGLKYKELCGLAEAFGFNFQRQSGSHKIFAHDAVREIMNFQNDRGKAKAYQVKQLLNCIERHQLKLGGEEND